MAIANNLLRDESCTSVESVVADARCEIRQLHKIIAAHPVTHPPLQDEIIAYGEQLSSRLLAAVLRENGLSARYVDARRCIKTDDNYGSAAPLPETQRATHVELVPLIEAGEIPVLGGFIGSTAKGVTTTLGRGGSDFTAALVGATIESMQMRDLLRSIDYLVDGEHLKLSSVSVYGRRGMGALALYAAAFDERISRVILDDPPPSHWQGPALLNILRITDLPEAAGLMAPREIVSLTPLPAAYAYTSSIYALYGKKNRIRQAGDLGEALAVKGRRAHRRRIASSLSGVKWWTLPDAL